MDERHEADIKVGPHWYESRARQPEGCQYSAFCEYYRRWRQQLTM